MASIASLALGQARSLTYTIVDTGQDSCFNNAHEIASPREGEAFFGQDAQYSGAQPAYRDNHDDTITDLNTGLTWVKVRGEKVTWDDAVKGASACRVGGYHDWRLPTIKELYSLINFTGGCDGRVANSTPYIDIRYFEFAYGDESQNERIIDCQDWSATEYIGTTMGGNATVFGVNFADGRIKGYPKAMRRREGVMTKRLYVRYVRGNPRYGQNDFHDNGDGSISDRATGLIWSQGDSGRGMNWEESLAWVAARNRANYLGHSDWRLPNAKELQSIVDYTQAPSVTRSPAIDPLFTVTRLPDGDYPFFWTGTTHLEGPAHHRGTAAVYIAFGSATGWMQFPPHRGPYRLEDVHGAGAQRSDPKAGEPEDYPRGRGPQGDVIRISNYVRCVRE
ncbi:MAG: DUF1566 domain-containing protein [Lentisphaerae bacterium]|nr:DUF1566 domain-containing protein [Lentisphaerota bacterium]